MPTVAQHMIAALEASGVRRVHGIPGDSLNGFTDAIRRSAQISWEHVVTRKPRRSPPPPTPH